MNTATRGGQLQSLRSSLERDRAQSIGNAANQAREQGIGRALQFASGALPTQAGITGQQQSAMQGLSAANATATERAIQQAKQQQQSSAGKGSLLGTIAKGAFGGW